MPAAAKRASMPPPGSSTGVSGGAGDPREARTVDVDAVEEKRFMGFGAMSAGCIFAELLLLCWLNAGCWSKGGSDGRLAFCALCVSLENRPSLSGVSGPGDSGRGLGAVPRLSARRGPLFSTGLDPILGLVSYEPFLLPAAGLP
jgi:hypothetical protein